MKRGLREMVEVTEKGVQTFFGAGLSVPIGIAVYECGNGDEIFVSDAGNNWIVKFVQ